MMWMKRALAVASFVALAAGAFVVIHDEDVILPDPIGVDAATPGGGDTILCSSLGLSDAGTICPPPPPPPEQPYFFVDGGPQIWYRATGDSITLGYNPLTGSPDPSHSWPQFASYDLGTNVRLTDVGQLGWTGTQVLDAEAPAFAANLHDGGINLISYMAGANDIHFDASAAAMETNARSFVDGAHDAGWLVLVTTITPFHYLSGWTAIQSPVYNGWVMDGGSGADAVCDVSDLPLDMIERDGVHPYYSGHVRMGERCATALRAALAEAGAF